MDLKCNPQLKWYCKGCAVIPYLQHLKSTLVGELRDLLRNDINNAISSLKQDFGRDVCPPRPVNDTHISDDGNYPPLAPTQINTGASTNTNVTGPKQPQPPLLHGTGSSSNNDHAIKTVTVSEPRFWIYFAHISPDVTADNFTTFVKSRLNTSDVMVFRLVKQGADESRLSFVSFKVGVPLSLKAKALSPCSWPPHLAFREFLDYNARRDFHQPPLPPSRPRQSTDATQEHESLPSIRTDSAPPTSPLLTNQQRQLRSQTAPLRQ